ncbi:hypothetical protein HAV21_03400 [Paenarthrobacter sp. MSM-2-10-13]|uniref:hypothetical protein n=1 Tax=Paenarthrobacter sp. MSM-2-10-13 TaxID=2717318 RepID=UPI001423DE2E|nr:hypothetical protein [Paenarthrobacter sp. MSM-2-10-13]NHW45943.1 hypothetical protein [Paenarthrobacter sp. MSM-2-10-13]
MTAPQEDVELHTAIVRIVDGFRFDQEWITSRAADFPEHKGAGCGCGVCQKMVGLNHRVADCIMTFVAAHDEQREWEIRLDEVLKLKNVADHQQQFVGVRRHLKSRKMELTSAIDRARLDTFAQAIEESVKDYPRKYPDVATLTNRQREQDKEEE